MTDTAPKTLFDALEILRSVHGAYPGQSYDDFLKAVTIQDLADLLVEHGGLARGEEESSLPHVETSFPAYVEGGPEALRDAFPGPTMFEEWANVALALHIAMDRPDPEPLPEPPNGMTGVLTLRRGLLRQILDRTRNSEILISDWITRVLVMRYHREGLK